MPQAQLVFDGPAFVVLNSSAYLVIDNSNTNAISKTGSGGIISEGEGNIVKWGVDAIAGAYTVPFTRSSVHNNMSMTATITTSGDETSEGSGYINFSAFGGAGAEWVNSAHLPTGVSNVNNSSGEDNSAKIIDRFWVVDAGGYDTKPAVTLSFTYLEDEITATGNTITGEGVLTAQRWNTTTSNWVDFSGGTPNEGANTFEVVVPAADFFKVWTLVDETTPLPIELLYFNGKCNEENIK